MDTIIRSVSEIDKGDRQAIEHVVGRSLSDNQQVLIQIRTAAAEATPPRETPLGQQLPEWCNVYGGLSGEEIAEIEKSIIRECGNRPSF